MQTIDQLLPICKYAHQCSIAGADPETFTSYTGSDSLTAQVGLFRYLKNEAIIDDSMNICDLTSGRGDGKYALNHLGLNSESYTNSDTFTKLNHHPDVVFKDDYDVFKNESLKFITRFDFVHIDISFTGDSMNNMLDVIMLLEQNNISYSIRMNSCQCKGYTNNYCDDLPTYSHRIAYAMNKTFKPYQIYLIGTPGGKTKDWDSPPIKETMAFRSMALSFSKLLSPLMYNNRLTHYVPNSASVCVPNLGDDVRFIVAICENSILQEQQYYSDRYITEIGSDFHIFVNIDCLEEDGKSLIEQYMNNFAHNCDHLDYTEKDYEIGNVSKKSRPYHEQHVEKIKERSTRTISIDISICPSDLLLYFRTRHPLSKIRSACNVCLGMLTFCPEAYLSGFNKVKDLWGELTNKLGTKQSMHQREVAMAIKLLILSSFRNDYQYGIRYCHSLLSKSSHSNKSMIRTLRTYRLLSYLFERFRTLINTGILKIQQIDAIRSEIEDREVKKYKYRAKTVAPQTDLQESPEMQEMIFSSVDKLFESLERYALSSIVPITDTDTGDPVADSFSSLSMHFDLGIESRVEEMIKKLNLVPTGPFGIIDLGDDFVAEGEDW